MMERSNQLKVLVVEDNKFHKDSIKSLLEDQGYMMYWAKNLDEAFDAVRKESFHISIVDLFLRDEIRNESLPEGIVFLKTLRHDGLLDYLPSIVLTAYAKLETMQEAQALRVRRYIPRDPGYQITLMNEINDIKDKFLGINFDLEYEADPTPLIEEVIATLRWKTKKIPTRNQQMQEIKDLLGNVFVDATKLILSPLLPGMSGTGVIKVHPNYKYGPGQLSVLKIGRKSKIEREDISYSKYVKHYLSANKVTKLESSYRNHLGAINYTFAIENSQNLQELDEIFDELSADEIIEIFRRTIENTCVYWYQAPQNKYTDLISSYFESLDFSFNELVWSIQELIPEINPFVGLFMLDSHDTELMNPLAWIQFFRSNCVSRVYTCITHGDLNLRNIMVSVDKTPWLIDFYRTGHSHILRDAVVFETDLKFRILPELTLEEFIEFDCSMLNIGSLGEFIGSPPSSDNYEIDKITRIISGVRSKMIAHITLPGKTELECINEYLIALLMATLNVSRISKLPEKRRIQAFISASKLCEKITELSIQSKLQKDYRQNSSEVLKVETLQNFSDQVYGDLSVQEYHLIDLLKSGKLALFVGSEESYFDEDLPSLNQIAQILTEDQDLWTRPPKNPYKRLSVLQAEEGARIKLIGRIRDYFDSFDSPMLYQSIASIKEWNSIFTTNIHTYLEVISPDSIKALVSEDQLSIDLEGKIPLYKLLGSLDPKEISRLQGYLPLSDREFLTSEYRDRYSILLNALRERMENGISLLILGATTHEIDQAAKILGSLQNYDYAYIASKNFGEDENVEFIRSRGFRLIDLDPLNLLQNLSTNVNVES